MLSSLTTKASSLALEAKYIRKQELKFAKRARKAAEAGRTRSSAFMERNRESQYLHRISKVREEARLTNIARGFLRGRSYAEVEQIVYHRLLGTQWDRVRKMVAVYGDYTNPRWKLLPMMDSFEVWLVDAKNHFAVRKPREKQEREANTASGC